MSLLMSHRSPCSLAGRAISGMWTFFCLRGSAWRAKGLSEFHLNVLEKSEFTTNSFLTSLLLRSKAAKRYPDILDLVSSTNSTLQTVIYYVQN